MKALSLLISLFLFAACGGDNGLNGLDGQDGSSCSVTDNGDGSATLTCPDGTSATIGGPDCSVPPSTLMMQTWWDEADMFRRDCWNRNDHQERHCQDEAMTSEDRQACRDQFNYQAISCSVFYARWVNVMPLRECGVAVFTNIADPDTYDPEDPDTWLYELNFDDEDGDGIPTRWEFTMGYNPCTPNSFGSCVNDADLDFDADNIPNGEDEYPICNWGDDPGEWPTDCV